MQRPAVLLVLCVSAAYSAHCVYRNEAFTFTRADPGWRVQTIISLVEDRDLDLKNQLPGNPAKAADQTARGRNGEWYPLHEYLMPILTVPSFLLLGVDGCLDFNVLMSVLVILVAFQHQHGFNRPFLAGVRNTLLNPTDGLLVGCPLLIIVLVFGGREYWHAARSDCRAGHLARTWQSLRPECKSPISLVSWKSGSRSVWLSRGITSAFCLAILLNPPCA